MPLSILQSRTPHEILLENCLLMIIYGLLGDFAMRMCTRNLATNFPFMPSLGSSLDIHMGRKVTRYMIWIVNKFMSLATYSSWKASITSKPRHRRLVQLHLQLLPPQRVLCTLFIMTIMQNYLPLLSKHRQLMALVVMKKLTYLRIGENH